MTTVVDIPLFAGHGTSQIHSEATRAQALRDCATSSVAATILAACHVAFRSDTSKINLVDADDFSTPQDLLCPSTRYRTNALVSASSLFLVQVCRVLASGESIASVAQGLGFSSGGFALLLFKHHDEHAGTEPFVQTAVALYRYAILTGSLVHRAKLQAFPDVDEHRPWSVVILGVQEHDLVASISQFSTEIFLTARIDGSTFTISGRPDLLHAFCRTLSPSVTVHDTTVDGLYHAPTNIDLAHILATHEMIPNLPAGAKDLVYALLTQPVDWTSTIDALVSEVRGQTVRLINFGPGLGLVRGMQRVLTKHGISAHIFDVSLENNSAASTPEVSPAPSALSSPEASIRDVPREDSPVPRQDLPTPVDTRVAIVGMAVNMPGAPNVDALWSVLQNGINTCSTIPSERFSITPTTTTTTGNFLSHSAVSSFDARFFNISPREAKSMDPQQRIVLQCAYHALEDAGFVPEANEATGKMNTDNVGVYVGVATNDYVQNLKDDIDVYYSTGTLKSFLSGRISYALNLSGPSIVVDTACSSSSVAIYQACRALMNGDCDTAVAGGVNVISSPDMQTGLARAHFLSPSSQCLSFDASASGYSRSEGTGMFVLKPLSAAIRDKDNIHGVIRGVEVNQSGNASSITHPHRESQELLFERVLEKSGVARERVGVIEAHGTGTQAGDPTELVSIRTVFAHPSRPLHITSVKANIGHLEAASGSAALAKMLLMFKHNTIPAQISLRNLNPRIEPLENDGTVIPTRNTQWKDNSEGRMGLVNNFGASGSNAVILVEEHVSSPSISQEEKEEMFVLSAKTPTALKDLVSSYIAWLRLPSNEAILLSDLAYTLARRRTMYECKVAICAKTRVELVTKLEEASIEECKGKKANGGVVFVFSGQGGAYFGMGRELYATSSVFKSHMDECHSYLIQNGFTGILHVLHGEEQGQDIEGVQACLFSLQYSLAKLWMSFGVVPLGVVGHSLGEYAALVISGVLSLYSALELVASRARLMSTRCTPNSTGMLAVNLPQHSLPLGLKTAVVNSRDSVVIAGPLPLLAEYKQGLSARNVKSKLLDVPFGFHSAAMEPILEQLTLLARTLDISAPSIPLASNVFGRVLGSDEYLSSDYFARHAREPVLFSQSLESLMSSLESRQLVFVEIGPAPITLPMIPAGGGLCVPSMRKGKDDWSVLMDGVGKMSSVVEMDWKRVVGEGRVVGGLPGYPFAKTEFWVQYQESVKAITQEVPREHSVLPKEVPQHAVDLRNSPLLESYSQNGVFTTPIETLAALISGHVVGGLPLCPASVYIELALEAISQLDSSSVVISDMTFVSPLVYSPHISRVVITSISVLETKFSVSSRSGSEETVHATGTYKHREVQSSISTFAKRQSLVKRRAGAVGADEVFSRRTMYEVIFPRVVSYSQSYQTVKNLRVGCDGLEVVGSVSVPAQSTSASYVIDPIFTDTLLHLAGFAANLQGSVSGNEAYICTHAGSLVVVPTPSPGEEYEVYAVLSHLDSHTILAESYAIHVPSGLLVARLKDMQFRRVGLDGLKKALQRCISTSSPRSSTHNSNVSPLSSNSNSPRSVTTTRSSASNSPSPSPLPMTPIANFSSSSSLTERGSIVRRIIGSACGLDVHLEDHAELSSLGVDSLMSIEILAALREAFPGAALSAGSLGGKVGDVVGIVEKQGPSVLRSPFESPQPQRRQVTFSTAPSSQLEETSIRTLLSSILQVPSSELTPTVQFTDLGMDSLMAIEAAHELGAHLGRTISSHLFVECANLSQLMAFLSPTSVASSSRRIPSPSLIQIQLGRNEKKAPLVLIHDGSGLVSHYEKISLDLGRAVYAIPDPYLGSEYKWASVNEMARAYAECIRAQVHGGNVLLGGWSFGGVVAYEIALLLAQYGITVLGLVQIDTPNPHGHVPLSPTLISAITHNNSKLKTQFLACSSLLSSYTPSRCTIPLRVIYLCSRQGYTNASVPDIPRWLAVRVLGDECGWERIVGEERVRVVSVPGNHFEAFQEHCINDVSRSIFDAVRWLE